MINTRRFKKRQKARSQIRKSANSSDERKVSQSSAGLGGRSADMFWLRRSPPIFIQNLRVRSQLYYDYQLVLTSTAGVPNSYVFSANGMFDPNITGTGHQPLGFDNLMTLYDQYCVRSSSITVTVVGCTASVARLVLMLYDDSSISTTPERLVENGNAVFGTIAPGSDGQWSQCLLRNSCDVPKYFATGWDTLKRNPSYQGTAAANPTEQVYFAFSIFGGFSTSTMQVSFDVLISYDVEYFEPKHIATS